MSRSVRISFLAVLLLMFSACGSPATPAPTLLPTSILPTRIAILPTTASGTVASPVPSVIPSTLPPTVAPLSPTPSITLIPPTATRLLATATAPITAAPPTSAAASGGNAANGETLFRKGVEGSPAIPTCISCHNVDNDQILVGPSQRGIATRAGKRVPGQDAPTYIHNSIINPNAFLVPDEQGHVYSVNGQSLMYQNYAKDLTPTQINDLVAYLLTLK